MRLAASLAVFGMSVSLAIPSAAQALPPAKAELAVSSARELIGVTYQLGGRLRRRGGIDCQGLVFYVLERISNCGWRSYSVFPTTSVRDRELGAPVDGLFPVATEALDPAQLLPGDIVMLLAPIPNPAEEALTTLNGVPVWVWHIGLATGAGRWINADPFSAEVQEVDLAAYLKEYEYSGIAVTRMEEGPAPAVCRHHPPMRRPR